MFDRVVMMDISVSFSFWPYFLHFQFYFQINAMKSIFLFQLPSTLILVWLQVVRIWLWLKYVQYTYLGSAKICEIF